MSVESPDFGRQLATDASGSAIASPVIAQGEEPNEKHFKTGYLLENLKRRTVRSGVVTLSAQAIKFVLNLVATTTLARLLTPRDFGLVAMVTSATAFLNVFKTAGLAVPTVQRENITHAQVSNLFWINLALSGCCALIIASLAPVIAWFYHDQRLVYITLLVAVTFLIGGFRVQHVALLRRQLRFKAVASIDVGSMVISVAVAISMAMLGYGYWSLLGSILALEGAGFLLTGFFSDWRPQRPTRGAGIRPLLAFGAHQTAAQFIASLARGCDNILIGRFYGAAAVGLYSRGAALVVRPLEQFLLPINAVVLPTLSRLQGDPRRYREIFLRLYEVLALVTFFGSGLLLALSHPLTLVLLGKKWEQVSVIFAGFTFTALLIPFSNMSNWLMTSQGRGKDIFHLNCIVSVIMLISFVVGLPFGPVGVAVSFGISGLLIRLPILYHMVGRTGPVHTSDLWLGFVRHLPLWLFIFLTGSITLYFLRNLRPISQLGIGAFVGIVAGAAFIYVMPRQRRVALDLISTLPELRRTKQKQQ
jgi:O-antigen/teichoic acid export membrane protein